MEIAIIKWRWHKVRGKESIGKVLRKLREAKFGKRSGVKVVNQYPEFFYDSAHLTKVENGSWGMNSDKLSEYLKLLDADLYIVQKIKK